MHTYTHTMRLSLCLSRCQLFLDYILSYAKELGLRVSPSLPFPSPLHLPSPHSFFVQLLPMAHLAVCASEVGGVVEDRYFLVEVAELCVPEGGQGNEAPVPRIFRNAVTMVELDSWKLVLDSLHSVGGKTGSIPYWVLLVILHCISLCCSEKEPCNTEEKGTG